MPTGNLAMSISSFDPTAKTFAAAPVFETKIDLTHGYASNGCGPNGGSGAWNAWTPTDVFNSQTNRQCSYPQPWLTGIAFDRGNLVLGIRDRFGDQAGEDHPVGGEGVSAGDLLRACGSLATGWTLESNGSCGGVKGGGVGDKQGPGGGEFYNLESFSSVHQETSLGSVLQLAGSPNVMYTVFDPSTVNGNDWRSGGTHTDSNANGANVRYFEVFGKYDSSGFSCPAGRAATGTGTFGKANSLGELEAMCDKAPIEIGNRVWLDTNSNGVQDANEAGIGGVTVSLFEGIDGAGAINSGVIVLDGDEPLAEVDGKDACAGTPDNRNNLSIDFGFYGAAALGNYAWTDTNHDGLQNEPAENGVNGDRHGHRRHGQSCGLRPHRQQS